MTTQHISEKNILKYEQQRSLLVNQVLIRFTPTEYSLIRRLLDGEIVPDPDLAQLLTNHASKTSDIDKALKACLDKHIENIRSKIRPVGLYIFRVNGLGYVLR